MALPWISASSLVHTGIDKAMPVRFKYTIGMQYNSFSYKNFKADAVLLICSGYCPQGLWFFCPQPMRMKVILSALQSMMLERSAESSRSSCKVLI